MFTKTFLALAAAATIAQAWMPADRDLAAFNQTARTNSKRSLPSAKIRGVNLGGQFITEAWMMSSTWSNMGCNPNNLSPADCSNGQSEFNCMQNTNRGAQQAFTDKMNSWITADDIQAIHDAGLNTIRIPLGYWVYEDIVYDSEYFPTGQMPILDNLVQKAESLGMFVILDLHGAPYAQKYKDAFTGQCSNSPGFFSNDQYTRATDFLTWLTNYVHNNSAYDNSVGIIEVLNEPQTSYNQVNDDGSTGYASGETDSMTQTYYPQAQAAVTNAESALGTSDDKKLHVMFMDGLWTNNDLNPKSNIQNTNVAFDDHNYAYLGANLKQGDYMYHTCKADDRLSDGDTPKIVGEWAMTNSGNDDPNEFDPSTQQQFYKDWFTAQQINYEKANGWVWWTWKTELSDIRWDYQYAVQQGIIPNGASALDANAQNNVCCSDRWNYC